ncbi:MAG: class C beta-lactamase-related serine hydrolase [Alphaproteobacteria bacterium]|nr:MAG: class C beta-lactamase-related serine hydrolase [Alphaproteobacteria bacterium]
MKLKQFIGLVALIATPLWTTTAGANGINWEGEASARLAETISKGTYQTVTSVLVLENGATVYEGYFAGADAGTLHDTRSATKTVVSMAVGAAIEQGLIRDAGMLIAPYFPQYDALIKSDPRKADIRIEDLLTMSGPLECDDWNSFSRGNEERMYIIEDWTAFYWGLPARGFPAWQKPPAQAPYGRAFSYCTAGVQLLGETVERAAGEPFTDFVERSLFAPAGVTDFKWQRNGLGQAHMGGGLLLSTRSLGRLGEIERLKGMAGGRRVYSEDWAKAAITPHAHVPDTPFDYGYLWWLQPYEVGGKTYIAAAMSGNGGNRVWVLPDFGLTIVLTKTDFNTRGMHEAAQAFFDTEILPRLVADGR